MSYVKPAQSGGFGSPDEERQRNKAAIGEAARPLAY